MRLISIHKPRSRLGPARALGVAAFTLIEMVMVIAILAVVAMLSIDSLTNNTNEARYAQTISRLRLIRKGLVGEVTLKSAKYRSDFGYLGDVGGLPSAAQGLAALLANPGVPAGGWSLSSAARIGLGWNGPYFKADDSGQNLTKDGWGTALVYAPAANPPTVTSLGADRAAGGTGYNRDITMQLPANTLFATVHGFITQNSAQWVGAAEVELNEPGGAGQLVQITDGVVAADKGHFVFTNVPMGVRSATVYVPSKAAPTQTLGPIVFTVDKPYYVIQANLFDLGITPGLTNFEVPIEMLDYGLSSAIINLFSAFERTRTPLNTTDYDGAVSYAFEIVASNSGLLPSGVNLVNSLGISVGSITVPGLTGTLTRYRTAVTPTAGANDYRVQFPLTLLVNQLTVTSARIIVSQVNATKTNIYVPLLAENNTLTSNSDTVAVDSTTTTTYTQGTALKYSIWNKNNAVMSLATGNAYNLAVSMSGGNLGGTASVALYNRTTGLAVTGAVVTTNANAYSLQQAAFADTAVNFADLNDYELRIKSSSALQTASVAKGGLWIKLANIGIGEVYYRTGRTYTGTASPTMEGQRALIDTSVFSNPTVYAEGVGVSTAAAGATLSSIDAGTADSGTAGAAIGAGLVWGTAKSRQRGAALAWPSGDRCFAKVTTAAGTSNITSSGIVVQFHH